MADKNTKYQPPKRVDKEHRAEILEIGEKLVKLREKTGLSIFAYAKEIGIARNSYSLMERGMIYFSIENFLKILHHHKISINDFFSKDIDEL